MNYVTDLVKSDIDLFDIFRRIQHRAVICTTNDDEGGNSKVVRGLVCGHAYSLLQLDEVELDDGSFERIGKIVRNLTVNLIFCQLRLETLGQKQNGMGPGLMDQTSGNAF